MKREKFNIKYLAVCGGVVIVLIAIVVMAFNHKTLKCNYDDRELIKGMNQSEELKVTIDFGKIKKINMKQSIKINDYYDKKNTYYDSLEKLFRNAYAYLGDDVTVEKVDKSIVANISTKREGIVLNNITIKQNGVEDTTLRYDAETDLKNENAINIKDKINKEELKNKIEKLGYKCK